ncbi:hypothetical protein HI914_04128 [Erysiphe necator]|nr:hypothetical protein HI914_04128 [Erysiphe necator]
MDEIPIAGFKRLQDQLLLSLKDPETCLDEKLIDEVQVQLTEEIIPIARPRLLPLLTKILPSYPKNPKLLSELSQKLLRSVGFRQVLDFASEENLVLALKSPFPAANLLGIDIVSKASWAPSHTTILSNMKPLILAFIQTWLCSPDVAVGEAATQTLGDLLEMDCDCRKALSSSTSSRVKNLNVSSEIPLGQGLLWRRIFQDQDIYNQLFSLCDLNAAGKEDCCMERRQISIAQGRLLQLLPRLATFNFQIISQSQFPMVEETYIGQPSGILFYAATKMINKNDLLMHMILITFFGDLLSMLSKETISPSDFNYLSTLVNQVAHEDISLKESIEESVRNPETAPELLELLSRLTLNDG